MAKYDIFFGTYSKGTGRGLFRGIFDTASGEIRLTGTVDIENPSYLQLHKGMLYGVSELSTFNGENGGALFAVDITGSDLSGQGAGSPEMRLLDIHATHGKHPCHLCIKDNHIFVCNYSEGSLSIYEIGEGGRIKPSFQSLHHFGARQGARTGERAKNMQHGVSPNKGFNLDKIRRGAGKNADRQAASHIHFAAITLDGKFLAICDLGMDKVFFYPYCAEKGLSLNAKMINCPPGSGPRHLALCGSHVYVLTELGNTVLCYQYNAGDDGTGGGFPADFQLLQEISTLPAGFTGRSTAAAIHLSPDNKFLAASNRGHDSIAVYNIGDDHRLTLVTHIMTGKEPRDFRFSPCGKWLLAANQNDDSVTVYSVENNFKQTGSVHLPKPVCILFEANNG